MDRRIGLHKGSASVAIAVSLALGPCAVEASNPTSFTDAFLVNPPLLNNLQVSPRVAMDKAGDFVVVWQTYGTGIYAQRYDSQANAEGSPILVNAATWNAQGEPAVAMDSAGDFVVTWSSEHQGSSSGDYDIYARQYTAAGNPVQSNEFLVNTITSGRQDSPSVSMNPAGAFVVAWQSNQFSLGIPPPTVIYARQYDSSGTAVQASEFQANTLTTGATSPAVATDAGGDFVLAWVGTGGTYARQFTAAGSAVQAQELLVSTLIGDQAQPAVAMDPVGDFIVAWTYNDVPHATGEGIYVRQFTSAGVPLQGAEFRANTYITNNGQDRPVLATDASGDFVVVWESYGQISGDKIDVYGRQYDSTGNPLQSSEFLVDAPFFADSQGMPAIASDAAGDFVVAWQSTDEATNHSVDIYARSYSDPEQVDLAASLNPAKASTTTGSVAGFTLNVRNLTSGNSGSGIPDPGLGVASGVNAVFTLPTGFGLKNASGTNWTCGNVSGGQFTCSYNTILAPTSSASALTINLTAPVVAGNGSVQVGVSSSQADSNVSDNSASTSISVRASSGGGFDILSLLMLGIPLIWRQRKNSVHPSVCWLRK